MEKELISDEIKRTLSIEAASIRSLPETLDMDRMIQIVHLIGDCKGRIIIAGCGTSAMAARKIVHSLNCIERPAVYLTPSDAVHGGLGILQPGDIFILISKGGNTKELVQLIPACRAKKAALVGVSENPDSVIAKEADIFLKVKVETEPCRFNMLATASTLAVISTFDSICIALMQYTNYTKEQFAIIHPNGAVGERLTERVGR
jgi:KpsF/GutQ family protein